MKTILQIWLFPTLIAYFFFSIGNHTWDAMQFSQESSYFFGAVSFLSLITGALYRILFEHESEEAKDLKELRRKIQRDIDNLTNR